MVAFGELLRALSLGLGGIDNGRPESGYSASFSGNGPSSVLWPLGSRGPVGDIARHGSP